MDENNFLTSGAGLENLTAQEMGRPFLKICQSMTPERNKANGDLYIPGLSEGDIFNSLTKKNYGASVEVRLLARKQLWLVFDWGTDGKDGAFMTVTEINVFPAAPIKRDDGTENYGLWAGEFEGKKVRVKQGWNYAALVKGEEKFGPVIIPFFSLGNNDAAALARKLGTDRNDDGNLLSIFARTWTLTTQAVQRDIGGQKQTFYLYGDGKKTINAKRSVDTLTFAEYGTLVKPALDFTPQLLLSADPSRDDDHTIEGRAEALADDDEI